MPPRSDSGKAARDLTTIPGGAGRNALQDLRNEVLGMRDVYEGAGGEDRLGISDLVSDLSADTDERMRGHFATLNTEVVSLLGVSVGFINTDGDSMR